MLGPCSRARGRGVVDPSGRDATGDRGACGDSAGDELRAGRMRVASVCERARSASASRSCSRFNAPDASIDTPSDPIARARSCANAGPSRCSSRSPSPSPLGVYAPMIHGNPRVPSADWLPLSSLQFTVVAARCTRAALPEAAGGRGGGESRASEIGSIRTRSQTPLLGDS